jgi:hypothetical protein
LLHKQAVGSVAGSGGVTFRLPDIEVFTGKDKDEDYEKWRRTAVHKCQTYVDNQAGMVYLETRVKGNAWDLIKHDIQGAKHYLDILEAMDVYFEQEAYEKVMEAETALRDSSLQQKNGETFVSWKQRFMKVATSLDKSDREMIAYARKFMRPGLASATTAASKRGETLNNFLTRACKRDLEQKEIGRSRPTITARTPRERAPRKRSPNDRNPDRKSKLERDKKRNIAFGRTQEQRDVLYKNKACFKCGDRTHQSSDCKKNRAVPFDQIRGLNLSAVNAAYWDEEEVELEDEDDNPDDDVCDEEGYIVEPEYEQDF